MNCHLKEYTESKEPNGEKFFALKNRLGFLGAEDKLNPNSLSTRLSPIQKFRWVHFPRNAELRGEFVYQVSPVFMNDRDELSYGQPQQVMLAIQLGGMRTIEMLGRFAIANSLLKRAAIKQAIFYQESSHEKLWCFKRKSG